MKDLTSIVCKVSPTIRRFIMEGSKRLRVGMRSCPVKDRIHVTQCGKCLRFGHKTKLCYESSHTCAFCSLDHKSSDCLNKNAHQHQCKNCDRYRNLSTDSAVQFSAHSAFSDICPVFMSQKTKMINRTNWGGDIPSF